MLYEVITSVGPLDGSISADHARDVRSGVLDLVLLHVDLLGGGDVHLHPEPVLKHLDEPAVFAEHLLRKCRVDVQRDLLSRQKRCLALEFV